MKLDANLHPVQSEILNALLFVPEARFSDLNITGLTSDHFNFHIKSLLTSGLVEKTASGKYKLTGPGKEFANRMDTDAKMVERQGKLSVLLVSVREMDGETQFLMQQRLKHPYYGFWGYMSGKIRWGEEVLAAAKRELKEETGLSGKLEFKGIQHKIDYTTDGKLLEDKYFYIVKATNHKGKFIASFGGGKNQWMTRSEVLKLAKADKVFQGVTTILDGVLKPGLHFWENKFFYTVDEY